MKKIGQANTFLFEDHIILSFSKDWIEQFGELPKFDILLDDSGKLHLRSTKSTSYRKNTKHTKSI